MLITWSSHAPLYDHHRHHRCWHGTTSRLNGVLSLTFINIGSTLLFLWQSRRSSWAKIRVALQKSSRTLFSQHAFSALLETHNDNGRLDSKTSFLRFASPFILQCYRNLIGREELQRYPRLWKNSEWLLRAGRTVTQRILQSSSGRTVRNGFGCQTTPRTCKGD